MALLVCRPPPVEAPRPRAPGEPVVRLGHAQRPVADGEIVVDVPAKLAARARLFDTGNGRKTDPAGAHYVAVVALRMVRRHRTRAVT